MAGRNGSKADNGIHRRADVMGHIGKEGGFRPVGMLRLHQGILQGLGLFPLLFLRFRNILCDNHYHNIIRIGIFYHKERLADADQRPGWVLFPIFHGYFPVPQGKPFL